MNPTAMTAPVAPPLGPASLRTNSPAHMPTWNSQQLFRPGVREVQIEHHGMLYRLRVTAQGKLILTK